MERGAAWHTGPSACHPADNRFIWYIHIDRIINGIPHLCQCFIQYFRLWNGTWKSVQDISVPAIFSANSVHQDLYGQFIRYKKSLIHVTLHFFSKLSTVFDIRSENISCRNVRHTVSVGNHFRLCPFSCSRSPQHNNLHFKILLLRNRLRSEPKYNLSMQVQGQCIPALSQILTSFHQSFKNPL